MATSFLFISLLSVVTALDPRVAAILKRTDIELAPPSLLPRSGQCTQINPIGGSTAGVSYYNGQPSGCPVINRGDSDGTCTSSMTIKDGACAGYCEVRNFFFYGQEVPFAPVAHCSADEACSIQASQSATITQTYGFNTAAHFSKRDGEVEQRELVERQEEAAEALLKFAFDLGASYSWSDSKSTTTGLTDTRPTNNNASDCGYWTNVPIFWQSCGTLTTAPTAPGYAGSEIFKRDNTGCLTAKAVTTGNYCNTTPYLDSNGKNAGIPIFVVTGCTSNKLQPASMQDPVFQYPGVAATPFSGTFQD